MSGEQRHRHPHPGRDLGDRAERGGAGGRGAGPASGRTAASPAERLLVLQRLAGNAAVSSRLSPPLQRFVGKEHKQLGDSSQRTVDLGNGVVLSFGDLVALSGDEYRSIDDLLADTRTAEGRARLLAAIRDDYIPDPAGVTLPEPSAAQKSERFATFLGLASDNPLHFNADQQGVGQWAADHTAALTAALEAGLQDDPAGRQLALAREAFGQHYLTDAFSGGHIRTPRPDIIGWYRQHFGDPVVEVFISRLSRRLIDGLVIQISPQTKWLDFLIRQEVEAAVGARLAKAIAGAGGRAKINDFFALGLAGVVSGAMHDLEGRRGVMVASEAHPVPWVAFGDAQLAGRPESRQQAELAVVAAVAHVDRAFDIGHRHSPGGAAADRPSVTHFGFDSATLEPTAAAAVAAAAAYLHGRPEVLLTLTGHTDPSGSDAHNDELGMRRAQAVAAALTAAGASPTQLVVLSQGKRSPVTLARGQLALDRRVAFSYQSRPGPHLDVGRQEAPAELRAAIPPPYADVTRFVPKPLPPETTSPAVGASSTAHAQVVLEDWRWGSIPQRLRAEVNAWVKGYGPMLTTRLAGEPALDDTTVEGYAIQPRPLVNAVVVELLNDAAGFLEAATGEQMSP